MKLVLALLLALPAAAQTQPKPVLDYIRDTWSVLTRSHKQLAIAAVDPKFQPGPDGKWIVYIPADENVARISKQLTSEMAPGDFAKIRLVSLEQKGNSHQDAGLLYLPRPYVVPGGRFNEMYGWDSYFIQVGLLRDGLVPLARDMADNFLYEVREYGKVLNANRSYYLTRSQPPFLTEMVLGGLQQDQDRKWLADSLPAIEMYYRFWTTEPHLTKDTGLSRYFDLGDGPASEVLSSERDAEGRTHYNLIKAYFKTHTFDDYDVNQYFQKNTDGLTDLFYKGDRSMRESGFDPSNRFGPFNIDVIHYDPVCLNTLLYLMEQQTAEILDILNRSSDATAWRQRAQARAALMNRLMWEIRGRPLLRLQLLREVRSQISVPDHVLPPMGRNRHQRASRAGGEEPAHVRAGRRPANQHACHREPVGLSLRLGPAGAHSVRRTAPLRLQ